MVRILASLYLYAGESSRQTPFETGYRPLFDVVEGVKTSGMITLLDREQFFPGDEGMVEIKFIEADCSKGMKFQFSEGREPLGEATVIRILQRA